MELALLINFVSIIVGVQGIFFKDPIPSPGTSHPNQLLVFDTDGGIDDVLALLLLLTTPATALLKGVTCLFGDTDRRNACDNVLRILALTDRHGIPVHEGSTGSITTGKFVPELGYFIGLDGLGNRSHEYPTFGQHFSGIPAALALSRMARLNPGAITLLAVGPLTNLALAHRIDPYFTQNLREIVILGGNFNGSVMKGPAYPEFNFRQDPLAANIILTEAVCPLTVVPFEATLENGIPWDIFPELAMTDTRLGHFFRRVTQIQHVRERARGDLTYVIYDFVATAVVLYPEIVTSQVYRTLAVDVAKGETVVVQGSSESKVVRIVTDVDGEAIVELFRRMLNTL